jgi:hypothetical protein
MRCGAVHAATLPHHSFVPTEFAPVGIVAAQTIRDACDWLWRNDPNGLD